MLELDYNSNIEFVKLFNDVFSLVMSKGSIITNVNDLYSSTKELLLPTGVLTAMLGNRGYAKYLFYTTNNIRVLEIYVSDYARCFRVNIGSLDNLVQIYKYLTTVGYRF